MPDFNKTDFSGNPVRLDAVRSKFRMPFKHKTTFDAGRLIPIFSYGDVLPGDTFKVNLSALVRMSTPVFPTMDDAFLDVYFFFTPHKLTLSRRMMSPSTNDGLFSWDAYIGAQDSLLNMPLPSNAIKLPYLQIHGGTASNALQETQPGSLADYLGLAWTDSADYGISPLEPLAYYSIWNNYFRDPNTMNPVVYTSDNMYSGTNPDLTGRYLLQLDGFDSAAGHPPLRWSGSAHECTIGRYTSILPVCRPHGYFGSALPWPQRNSTEVSIPLSGSVSISADGDLTLTDGDSYNPKVQAWSNSAGMYYGTTAPVGSALDMEYKSGLVGSISNANILVNQLRLSVQTQRFYEALARGGNRIGEITASMFGVVPSDYGIDRPEYLGGKRIPIQIDQVANTAGPNASNLSSALGTLGAYSNTGDSDFYFEKSFDTWGTITCVVCVRTNESFCQGIPRRYTRKTKFDHYWPQFANLGEQPILEKEIYVDDGSLTADAPYYNKVFGYQEAWAEYRYLPDIVSGELRPQNTLGAYTYCNFFQSAPTLAGYLSGNGVIDNIDRTLHVSHSAAGFQFIGDFAFDIVATRPMPRYSIPGLVDHH